MAADIIQARYELLDKVADCFARQAELMSAMRQRMQTTAHDLRRHGWHGRGAASFFNEMDMHIFPATERFHAALEEARLVTLQIKNILVAAEMEAARHFTEGRTTQDRASAEPMTDQAPMTPGSTGDYVIGPPTKPAIHHDNGFLDYHDPESPTLQDYIQLAEWRAFLEASKLATQAGIMDLDDANDAYEHFLYGNGADRTFDLEEFFAEDPAGQQTLQAVIRDAQQSAEELGQSRDYFEMSSRRAFAVGASDPFHPDHGKFPYPATENWQKAIGSHAMWTSASVQVGMNPDGSRRYTMELTIYAEDRYNFNPGMHDIASGIPDAANGRFEITGLAKQYTNYGQTTRVIEWNEGDYGSIETFEGPFENRGARPGAPGVPPLTPLPHGIRDDEPRTRPPVDQGLDKVKEKVGR
jgi:WXG100 family type VII secretion target